MKRSHMVILGLLLAAIGALLFALLPVTTNLVIAYAFYLLAIILLILNVSTLGARNQPLLMELPFFLIVRLYLLGTVLFSALVLVITYLGVYQVPISLHLLAQAALLLVVGIRVVPLLMGKAHIEETGSQAAQAHQRLSGLTADLKAMAGWLENLPETVREEAGNALDGLSDALRFADPVSTPAVAQLDQAIQGGIQSLRAALHDGKAEKVLELTGSLRNSIRERGEKLKISK